MATIYVINPDGTIRNERSNCKSEWISAFERICIKKLALDKIKSSPKKVSGFISSPKTKKKKKNKTNSSSRTYVPKVLPRYIAEKTTIFSIKDVELVMGNLISSGYIMYDDAVS